MENKGVIYILTNQSFPEYVKIGYADDVKKRLQQLNRSECIPFAFRIYATYGVADRLSDIQIHSIIDSLNPNLRAIENFEGKKRAREFYAMTPEDAYKLLEGIAKINGMTNNLKKYSMPQKDKVAEETAEEIKEEKRSTNVSPRSLFQSVELSLERLLSFMRILMLNVLLLTIKMLNMKVKFIH